MSKILISYRREDSADVTGRIFDRLIQQFGREAIFKDVDSIPLGVDFRTYLDEQVAKCEVFLAVIGRDWMKILGSTGKTRLDDPRDLVRIEIESALKRQIPVIPVLVSGATIPPAMRLPPSIQDLSYRNGIPVRADPDFHRDMDRLIDYLKQKIQGLTEDRKEPVSPLVEPLRTETPTDMVKVPKGPFLYGEKRVREVIDHDYWIDTYPLTNEKYRAFILADGYGKQAYWSEEGWKWKTNHNIVAPDYWNDTKWNKADYPVVGVSYFEAEAYAKWVGKRLPTEREWKRLHGARTGPRTGPSTPGGTRSTRANATAVRQVLVKRRPSPNIPMGLVPMGAMTWPEMSGSGVQIGITKNRKIGAWLGAAPGSTIRCINVYPTGTGSMSAIGAATSAYVLSRTFLSPVSLFCALVPVTVNVLGLSQNGVQSVCLFYI